MDDLYIYLIVALLPLSSLMLMLEVNPYNALIVRGILGAVAVLTYVVLGAADVALTEALMGTMLAVSLYVIAVRSSLVMRLGVVKSICHNDDDFNLLINNLRQAISQIYLRLEIVTYEDQETLETALNKKEIHGICLANNSQSEQNIPYQIKVRVARLCQVIEENVNKKNFIINLINY